jgi:hypothetical protein
MVLQIAFPVSPLFLQRSALPPGVYPTGPKSSSRLRLRFAWFNVFSSLRTLLRSSRSFSFCTRVPLFSAPYRLFCKIWGVGSSQRGRGRNGGRAVSGRGRMRNRGPSGGGTFRSESPQQGQRPSSQNARVVDALHREAGQKLHIVFPQRPARFCVAGRVARDPNCLTDDFLARILSLPRSAVKRKDHNMLGCLCHRPLAHSMPAATRKIKRSRA